MLKQSLISLDETEIDFQKEWNKTIFYRIFKIKNPLKSWKRQLIRINKKRKHFNTI